MRVGLEPCWALHRHHRSPGPNAAILRAAPEGNACRSPHPHLSDRHLLKVCPGRRAWGHRPTWRGTMNGRVCHNSGAGALGKGVRVGTRALPRTGGVSRGPHRLSRDGGFCAGTRGSIPGRTVQPGTGVSILEIPSWTGGVRPMTHRLYRDGGGWGFVPGRGIFCVTEDNSCTAANPTSTSNSGSCWCPMRVGIESHLFYLGHSVETSQQNKCGSPPHPPPHFSWFPISHGDVAGNAMCHPGRGDSGPCRGQSMSPQEGGCIASMRCLRSAGPERFCTIDPSLVLCPCLRGGAELLCHGCHYFLHLFAPGDRPHTSVVCEPCVRGS